MNPERDSLTVRMEEWKVIDECPDYSVSSLGRVRGIKSKDLKGSKQERGYRTVLLCKEGKHYRRLVHRLVALAFIPNPDNKEFIDHIDRNKTNNTVSNLRWATRTENCLNLDRTNITKHPYIYHSFRVCPPGGKQKNFKTLEEAIEYRDSIMSPGQS